MMAMNDAGIAAQVNLWDKEVTASNLDAETLAASEARDSKATSLTGGLAHSGIKQIYCALRQLQLFHHLLIYGEFIAPSITTQQLVRKDLRQRRLSENQLKGDNRVDSAFGDPFLPSHSFPPLHFSIFDQPQLLHLGCKPFSSIL